MDEIGLLGRRSTEQYDTFFPLRSFQGFFQGHTLYILGFRFVYWDEYQHPDKRKYTGKEKIFHAVLVHKGCLEHLTIRGHKCSNRPSVTCMNGTRKAMIKCLSQW